MPFGLDFADLSGGSGSYGSTAITTTSYPPTYNPATPSSSELLQAAQDDISNQNIQATVAIGGGG